MLTPLLPSLRRRLAAATVGGVLTVVSPAGAQTTPAPASGAAPAPPPPPASSPSVPHPHAYGILVGTNEGGPGQATLRYAEDDARRVAQVLRELGRYGTTDMRVLVRPDAAGVLAAVDDVAAKLRAHQAKGEQAVLVFYYSGHAKANAFSLGRDELSITALRERLRQLPTTLTLVVLDACQSGQFARIKAAEAAADFSFNSVSRLTTKGIAVMASSTAQELSQESDELHSSYFTHHLVVALRGAADADGDGRVSLDEAYRYAYRRTLVATAQTQVGGQHVTLETDLAGQGDVAVTYPGRAGSHLELPAVLDGRVLVQHQPSGNIVAEVQKAPGSAVKLAFAAGPYEAIVRASSGPSRVVKKCALTLTDTRVTTLDVGLCQLVNLAGAAKGESDDADAPPQPPVRDRARLAPWQIESGIGFLVRQQDAFTDRLGEFGYVEKRNFILGKAPRARFHLGASKGVVRHLAVGAAFHTLGGDRYQRTLSDSSDSFTWDSYGASAFVRASTLPVGRLDPGSPFVELYAQGALGLTMGVATLTTGSSLAPQASSESTDVHWGYVLGGHAGAAFASGGPLVFFLQGGYEYAPTIGNDLGEVHDSGGPSAQLGFRVRFE
jgi:hypothetical protein